MGIGVYPLLPIFGSFIGYSFKTLEYAGRGLWSIVAYSLDDHFPETKGEVTGLLNPDCRNVVYG
jgi:hypothetical protein